MKRFSFLRRQRSGFTLIELIIYIGITSLVVVSLTRVMITVFETRSRTESGTELQQSLRFIMNKMTTTIVGSQQFDWENSIEDISPGALTVVQDETRTLFVLTEEGMQIVHNDDVAIPLHGSGVVIQQLIFSNVSAASGPETVHILLEGTSTDSEANAQTMTIETSITLRQ